MKKLHLTLKKVFALPLLIAICALSFFGGIAFLNASPRATAESSATQTAYKNIALNKTYTAPTSFGDGYTANLTDGNASDAFDWGDGAWYACNGQGAYVDFDDYDSTLTGQGYCSDFVIDIGSVQLFSKVRIHAYAYDGNCQGWIVSTSLDGNTYTELGKPAVSEDANVVYWTEATSTTSVSARYVKVSALTTSFVMLNEIEVLAKYEATTENVAKDKAVSGPADKLGDATEFSTLTDGLTPGGWQYGGNYDNMTDGDYVQYAVPWDDSCNDGYGGAKFVYFIVDLGSAQNWNGVRIHGYEETSSGINKPKGIRAYALENGNEWSTFFSAWKPDDTVKAFFNDYASELAIGAADSNGGYWAEGTTSNVVNSRYVCIAFVPNGYISIDEIEVLGTQFGDTSLETMGNDVVVGVKEGVSDTNLAAGKNVYGLLNETYNEAATLSSLTDGQTPGGVQYGVQGKPADLGGKLEWTTLGGYTNYLIVDLGEVKTWSGVHVHGSVDSGSGVHKPTKIHIDASNDAISWTSIGNIAIGATDSDNNYWAGLSNVLKTTTSRFVRVAIVAEGGFTSIDEIEVYEVQETASESVNLAKDKTVSGPANNNANIGLDTLTDGQTFGGSTAQYLGIQDSNDSYCKYVSCGSDFGGPNWINYFIVDLGSAQNWNGVRVHGQFVLGVANKLQHIRAYGTNDLAQWTNFDKWGIDSEAEGKLGNYATQLTIGDTESDGGYWATGTCTNEVNSRYVCVVISMNGIYSIDEIEVLGEKKVEYVTPMPEGSDNIASGKTVSGPADKLIPTDKNGTPIESATEISTLTDGLTPGGWQYGGNYDNKTDGDYVQYAVPWDDSFNDGYGGAKFVYFIVDLGSAQNWNGVRIHGYEETSSGINKPKGIRAYALENGNEWSTFFSGEKPDDTVKAFFNDYASELAIGAADSNGGYWAEGTTSNVVNSRYVCIAFVPNGYISIDEIEVLAPTHILEEVAEKAPTAAEAGVKAHFTCKHCGDNYIYDEETDVYLAASDEDLAIARLTGFTGSNMALNSNLDMYYQAYVGGTPTSVQAKFTLNGGETIVDGTTSGNGEYVFVFKKLGPQNIGKDITAELIVDGETKDTKTSTAAAYLYNIFQQYEGDEKGQSLIADVFEYGAAAQTYLGDTSTKVNTLYTDVAACKTTFSAPTTTDKSIVENSTVSGNTFTAVNLKISNEVQIAFKFTATAGFALKVGGVDVTDKVQTNGSNGYVYYTDGISVTNFDKVFTAQLYSGETLVQTAKYSVNSYVYSKHNSENSALATIVKCLYNYGVSANDAQPVNRAAKRVNVAKGSSYTVDNGSATSGALTNGLTDADEYAAYSANESHTFVLDLKKKGNLAGFELHARSGAYTSGETTYSGVFPASVTVYLSSDNSTWTQVGVAIAPTKTQANYNYQIELSYAAEAQYVKFVVPAATTGDYYLIDEICAFVYSNTTEEYNQYVGGAEIVKTTTDVYYGSTDSRDKNLLSGLTANITAGNGLTIEEEYSDVSHEYKLKNTPVSESGVLTDGTELKGTGFLGSYQESDIKFYSNDIYFKFYGYDSRRITYDLGSICAVNKVTFRAFRHDSSLCRVPDVNVYLSMNGVDWYVGGNITFGSTTDQRMNESSVTVEKKARFVAYEFDVDLWVAIDELEVTGKKLKNESASDYARADAGTPVSAATDKGYPSAEGFASNVYLAFHSLKETTDDAGWGWTDQAEMEKIVAYHDENGNMTAPMFDGVLFLTNGRLHDSERNGDMTWNMTANSLGVLKQSLYCTGGYSDKNSNVKALNNAVAKMKQKNIVASDYKVKVYFTLYYPAGVYGSQFGTYEVNGESVTDISTTENKLKFLKLWIQDMELSFAFENLEIGGYYWYAESIDTAEQLTVATGVKEYLNEKGRKFVWIPYFDSTGYREWDQHFDIAVYQPNYAVGDTSYKLHESRLENAASIAKKYGMAIEFEMESHALTDARYRAHYYEYLARAQELGYANSVHFYYMGARIGDLLDDTSGVGREIYDTTFDFIEDGALNKPAKKNSLSETVTKGDSTDITVVARKNVTETMEILLREPPKHGTVTINADGTITYHADDDYTGLVTFTYVYSLAGVYSDVCTVAINVTDNA